MGEADPEDLPITRQAVDRHGDWLRLGQHDGRRRLGLGQLNIRGLGLQLLALGAEIGVGVHRTVHYRDDDRGRGVVGHGEAGDQGEGQGDQGDEQGMGHGGLRKLGFRVSSEHPYSAHSFISAAA